MSVKVGILAANQPSTAKARTFVDRVIALEMVRRMGAEKITARLIRLFPVDSVFSVLKPSREDVRRYVPEILPCPEISATYFEEPESLEWARGSRMPEIWDWSAEGVTSAANISVSL